ncbi:MAG: DEAD/DEAH box helicase family protein, partial [Clostridia bacterium]|nr:DEAD/DEAH box helicase family protein [Clostridia bacterium]
MLKSGLYEKVISRALGEELDASADKLSQTAPIDKAEASKVLAKYIADIVEKGLDNVVDNGGDLMTQVELANKIVSTIKFETKESEYDGMAVDERAEQLLALLDKQNSIYAVNSKAEIVRPETSIAQSSLFTGAVHEPQMFTELKKEIVSSNRIDMLVSFIKWSGLRLIMDELRTFTENGGSLRIITTSYMGATDVKAVEELRQLPNTEIKVSYDTKRTRLHAKTYVFYRDTGFTTAYVGSSNLSNAAISSGLEWNVKVTMQDLPDTIRKISATFESYWNSSEFEDYDEAQRERLEKALKAEKYFENNSDQPYTFDITPYPYQQEILDKIRAEREVRGNNKNLIVAATGTGKTVISAFDYRNFCKKLGRRAR